MHTAQITKFIYSEKLTGFWKQKGKGGGGGGGGKRLKYLLSL